MQTDTKLQELIQNLEATEKEMKARPMAPSLRLKYLQARFDYEQYKILLTCSVEGIPV